MPLPKGYRHSQETREKMSKTHKLIPSSMLGKHHSEETKAKLRLASIKAGCRPPVLRGKDNPNFGKPMPEATRQKLSLAKRGCRASKETREKQRNAHLGEKNHFFGKKHTYETREKMSKLRRSQYIASWSRGKILLHVQIRGSF